MSYGIDPPRRRRPWFWALVALGLMIASAVVTDDMAKLGLIGGAILSGIAFLRSLSRPPEEHGFGTSETVSRPKSAPVDVGIPDADLPPPVSPEAMMEMVDECLARGSKIEAIKYYRQVTGAGLRAAKDAVEAREAQMMGGSPPRRDGPWG